MDTRKPLVIERIHMYEKENAKAHRTDLFKVVDLEATPVLRRGQIFDLSVHFNRDWAKGVDDVRLIFSFGKTPNTPNGTQGVVTLNENRNESLDDLQTWGAKLLRTNGKDCTVQVRSPVNSPVGLWTLHVETRTLNSGAPPNTYRCDKAIYILFNPWQKDDLTYMEDKELLNEYVLSAIGKIWKGWVAHHWNFGQFEACVLPACLLMFERSGLKDEHRGDPIRVSRAISKTVNSPNDDGVVTGNWSGTYTDGVAPWKWTGSPEILEKFLKTEMSVDYGQCWVFGGVTTTVCRALGLPSRVVTNIRSAHDMNATLSIDRFYDENNVELEYDPTVEGFEMDKIWNFHVWNEVWMIRPDLPKGYGGWQAIDSTPQEESDNFIQCGPSSTEAIRQGAVGFNYDVAFMVATVNADCIRWKRDSSVAFGYSKISSNTSLIGRFIFTKAPFIFDVNGDQDRADITSSYKAAEGSKEERSIFRRAAGSSAKARRYNKLPSPEEEDVEFELVDVERVKIGEPFSLTVNINNKSSEKRTVSIEFSTDSLYYNGIKANKIKKDAADFVIHPNAREQIRGIITVDDYLDKLVEHSFIKIFAIGTVKETNQTWAGEDDFQVLKPGIRIEFEDDHLVVRKSSPMILSFHNPLKRALTKCQFTYVGQGLSTKKTLHLPDVAPGQEVRVEHALVPQKSGNHNLVVTFDSIELTDVAGCATIPVSDY